MGKKGIPAVTQQLIDLGKSIGGERVRLFVSREMPGGQVPRHWDEKPNYAPDTKDLFARIRADIKKAARSLYPGL